MKTFFIPVSDILPDITGGMSDTIKQCPWTEISVASSGFWHVCVCVYFSWLAGSLSHAHSPSPAVLDRLAQK